MGSGGAGLVLSLYGHMKALARRVLSALREAWRIVLAIPMLVAIAPVVYLAYLSYRKRISEAFFLNLVYVRRQDLSRLLRRESFPRALVKFLILHFAPLLILFEVVLIALYFQVLKSPTVPANSALDSKSLLLTAIACLFGPLVTVYLINAAARIKELQTKQPLRDLTAARLRDMKTAALDLVAASLPAPIGVKTINQRNYEDVERLLRENAYAFNVPELEQFDGVTNAIEDTVLRNAEIVIAADPEKIRIVGAVLELKADVARRAKKLVDEIWALETGNSAFYYRRRVKFVETLILLIRYLMLLALDVSHLGSGTLVSRVKTRRQREEFLSNDVTDRASGWQLVVLQRSKYAYPQDLVEGLDREEGNISKSMQFDFSSKESTRDFIELVGMFAWLRVTAWRVMNSPAGAKGQLG